MQPYITLLALDIVWITMVIKPLFARQIKLVQGSPMRVNYVGAVLSYAFLMIAYYTFIHNNKNASALKAFMLGLCLYGVYEATTIALLRKWEWRTVLVDTLWGGVLFWLTFTLAHWD